MTNSNSIQDVLFFPQMKPEKKAKVATEADFVAAGVPKEWAPVVMEAGIKTVEELKETKHTKLHHQISGLKKKMKLDIPSVSPEDVKEWVS